MSNCTRAYKKQVGEVLFQLKGGNYGLTVEQWKLAAFLQEKGLAKYNGPDNSPQVMSFEEFHNHAMISALSHYELTGLGEEFVARHSEKELRQGRFLLPGEAPWYDRWPWRLLLPAAVSVLTSVVTTLIVHHLNSP